MMLLWRQPNEFCGKALDTSMLGNHGDPRLMSSSYQMSVEMGQRAKWFRRKNKERNMWVESKAISNFNHGFGVLWIRSHNLCG